MRFEIEVTPLDLDLTLGCGQTFRWRCNPDGSWSGVLGDQLIDLRQKGPRILGEAIPGGRGVEESVLELLRTQDDIGKIQRRLRRDPVLALGMTRMKGLRIVKLDEWECLISYVLATYANIPRIMKMVEGLGTNYGRRIAHGAYSFPDRGQLSKATTKELIGLGLGYRAKYVRALCELIDESTLSTFSKAPYERLRKGLIELPGVGEKVADCVSLFGFGRLGSFPIDIWIERALARLYKQTGSYTRLRTFAAGRFGEYSGYAQEYLYHNERMHAREQECAFSKQRKK
jgi:N-glycosylase/DNA lyase